MSIDSRFVGDWKLDPIHSRLGFSARHAMVTKIRGAFNEVEGEAHIDSEDWANSTASVTIQVNSIDTRNDQRDEHLRNADFFNSKEFPTIEFVSTTIDEVDSGQFIVVGNLTMRGVTKSVSLPLEVTGIGEDSSGQIRAGLEGNRRIDRKEWGISWNEKLDNGGVMVSDKISLEFELSLLKVQ
ncbi:YceI family protein [Rothia aerolata]|uniref:Polyisoprenoid-binding protein n=1 Tax=Rothia aerolata TaxID=1812262 RepID=A0A917IRW3_9MICC|nr:YceI family protein [Rothia aerolata]GGH62036.1 polyisoprenoid-binding protein [Rothia aerolata]